MRRVAASINEACSRPACLPKARASSVDLPRRASRTAMTAPTRFDEAQCSSTAHAVRRGAVQQHGCCRLVVEHLGDGVHVGRAESRGADRHRDVSESRLPGDRALVLFDLAGRAQVQDGLEAHFLQPAQGFHRGLPSHREAVVDARVVPDRVGFHLIGDPSRLLRCGGHHERHRGQGGREGERHSHVGLLALGQCFDEGVDLGPAVEHVE